MVSSVKRGLSAVADIKNRPAERLFRRALKVVEGRLNARPLTENPINPEDSEPLTLNHFLLGHGNEIGSPFNTTGRDQISSFGYRRVAYLSQRIYDRWLKEYLPTMALRTRWLDDVSPPKIGDLVVWIRPGAERDNYKLARIKRLIPGKDGRTRVVEIRTSDGKERTVTIVTVARLNFESSDGSEPPTGGGDVVEPRKGYVSQQPM